MLNDNVLKKLHRIEPLKSITKKRNSGQKSLFMVEDKLNKSFFSTVIILQIED